MSSKVLHEIEGGACHFGRCKCKTQQGIRCKKCASPGSDYCYLHLGCAEPATGMGMGTGLALPTMGKGSRAEEWDSMARMKIEERARMYASQLSNSDISGLVPSLASVVSPSGATGTVAAAASTAASMATSAVAAVASPLVNATNVAMSTMGAATSAGSAALNSVIDTFSPAALQKGPAYGLRRAVALPKRAVKVDTSDAMGVTSSFFDSLVGLPTSPTREDLYNAGY